MDKTNVRELQDVVIRFSGDSGDGMQLTGTLFSDTSALLGNGISTFPDYPAEIRAPQGTVAGVSGFQVHFGSHRELNPGDYCDVLVAMNPAALKANRKWLKPGATVIIDGDSITEDHLKKACFATLDPIAELQLDEYNVVIPDITSMTREVLRETGLDNKAVTKCKNMFALGICFYLFDRPEAYAIKYIETKFAKKNPAIAEANKLAIRAGYDYAANTHQFANTYTVAPAPLEKGTYRSISGNVATAWGLCAAAEKAGLPLFCGSYPITPATVILEELAKRKLRIRGRTPGHGAYDPRDPADRRVHRQRLGAVAHPRDEGLPGHHPADRGRSPRRRFHALRAQRKPGPRLGIPRQGGAGTPCRRP